MSLQTVLDALTLLTFVTAFVFGVLEIRRANRAREEKGALDLFMSVVIQPPHVSALDTVLDLRDGASPGQVSRSKQTMEAANLLINQFEFWAVIVFQRIVPLATLDLLMGGGVRASWRKLHRYVEAERTATGNANLGEWFQWLAERLEQYPTPEKKLGAHVAFRSWAP